MSYTALCKQWKKEHDKKVKQDKILSEQQTQKEEQEKGRLIVSELLERIKLQQKQEEIKRIKDNVLLALRQNNPFTYPQYLIIWDILNTNYDQILSDYNRNRISKQDIVNAINYINNFSSEIINEYWQERLLSA